MLAAREGSHPLSAREGSHRPLQDGLIANSQRNRTAVSSERRAEPNFGLASWESCGIFACGPRPSCFAIIVWERFEDTYRTDFILTALADPSERALVQLGRELVEAPQQARDVDVRLDVGDLARVAERPSSAFMSSMSSS